MFYLRLAFKNVLRQYGRTTLSMLSIVAGVAVIILGRGLTGGFKENIIRAQVDTTSGHVMAVPNGYPETGLNHPVDSLLAVDNETIRWLNENTLAWTERTVFVARAVKGADALRVRAFGFDPDRDEGVFPRDQWKVEGKIPTRVEDGILASRGVASLLGVGVGGSLTLEVRTAAGAINALEVPVAGIFTMGNPTADRIGIFVPAALTQELVRNDGRFSHLALRIPDREKAEEVAAALGPRLGSGAEVHTWRGLTQGMVDAQDMRQFMIDVIALALVAIAATGIANTVLMATYERIREVGTLRAMGMARGGVVGLFVLEGLVMGVGGSAAGALLGGGVVWRYSVQGIDLSAMMSQASASGSYDNVPVSTMLYLEWNPQVVLAAVVFGVLLAAASSLYPAVLASRLQPADAVRAS